MKIDPTQTQQITDYNKPECPLDSTASSLKVVAIVGGLLVAGGQLMHALKSEDEKSMGDRVVAIKLTVVGVGALAYAAIEGMKKFFQLLNDHFI